MIPRESRLSPANIPGEKAGRFGPFRTNRVYEGRQVGDSFVHVDTKLTKRRGGSVRTLDTYRTDILRFGHFAGGLSAIDLMAK